MVQFLAHGDNGKYADAFAAFMRTIGHGQQWERAWLDSFGTAEGFEERWQKYWQELPADPTLALYAKASTAQMTGLLARATSQKQKFASFDDLLAAAQKKTLKVDPRDWLPASLIDETLASVTDLRKRSVGFALAPATASRGSTIVCTLGDGKKLTGRFKLINGHVAEVVVDAPR